jgi:hypothetical protein
MFSLGKFWLNLLQDDHYFGYTTKLTPQKIKIKSSRGQIATDRQTQKEDVPQSKKPLRLANCHKFMKMPFGLFQDIGKPKQQYDMSLLSILSFSITLEQQSKSSTRKRVGNFFSGLVHGQCF